MWTRYVFYVAGVASVAACIGAPDLDSQTSLLTASQRQERFTAIRNVSGDLGLSNGVLLAGIASAETGLAHCWSEATWACKGPASPSCDGGPVIAGSADGPCSAQQGGLGMYQFDAGTYAETLAREGEEILLLEGNIAAAVDFLQTRFLQERADLNDDAAALLAMNAIEIDESSRELDAWGEFLACRYNGCCNMSASLCQERKAGYIQHTLDAYAEAGGGDFWNDATDNEPDIDNPEDPDDWQAQRNTGGCTSGIGGGWLMLGMLGALRRRRTARDRR